VPEQRVRTARPSDLGAGRDDDIGADVKIVEEVLGMPRPGIGRRESVGILSEGEVVALLYRLLLRTGALLGWTDARAVEGVEGVD
jgi:hypothetical protein